MGINLYINGVQYGPYSAEDVRELLMTNRATVDDLCSSTEEPRPEAIQSRLEWFVGERYRSEPINLLGLNPYYQTEFIKIYISHEKYKGGWNGYAFLFGGLWALTKGLWLNLVVVLVCLTIISILTCGIGGLVLAAIVAVMYACRGNYMYYCAYVKRRQIAF